MKAVEQSWAAIGRFIEKTMPKGSDFRSVSILAGGTVVGQAIIALAAPLLTRLYKPNDFGVLSVYMSLLSILTVIASLRYQLTIPLPEKDEEAINLLALSFFIIVLIGVLTSIAVGTLGFSLVKLARVPTLLPYLWLLPISVMLAGTYQVFNYWAIRRKAFSRIAKTKINQGIGLISAQIGLGIMKVGALGLLCGHIIGQVAGTGTLGAMAWRRDSSLLKSIEFGKIFRLASRYRNFPIFSSWTGVLNTLGVHAAPLLISSFYGPTITGYYALGLAVLGMPVSLIGQSIAQVLMPSAVEAARSGSLQSVVESYFQKLVMLSFSFFIIFGLLAPSLFGPIFGKSWMEAGLYAQWMTPWYGMVFICSPLSILPTVLERQRNEALFNFLLLLGRIGVLMAGGIIGNIHLTIQAFAAVSALGWFIYMLWMLRIAGVSAHFALRIMFREVGEVALRTAPLIAFMLISKNGALVAVAAGISGSLLFTRVVRKIR